MRKMTAIAAFIPVLALAVFFALPAAAQDVKRMSIEELKSLLGQPETMIIDVRSRADWKLSRHKIKGALREDPEKVELWISKYAKDKTLVFYCA